MKKFTRCFVGVFLISPCLLAGPKISGPDEHGFQWATIGAPGNRHTEVWEMPNAPWLDPMGGVDYRYRMATTEVTNGTWFEFVQAYKPYVGEDRAKPAFIGGAITFWGFDGGGLPIYTLNPNFTDLPVSIGWRYAARFVNWLHNGKPVGADLTEAAFAQGVYDTTTFTTNPDNTINDDPMRAKNAKYWIPTLDEWIKAAHYDPNRYGEGEGGYWIHPGGQDEPLTPGLPGEPGAQTSAGIGNTANVYIPVGSYPDVNAPWGLLDTSGGASEWTSTIGWELFPQGMFVKGTAMGTVEHWIFDPIDSVGLGRPSPLSMHGLRLAAPIPSPGAFPALLLFSLWSSASERKKR